MFRRIHIQSKRLKPLRPLLRRWIDLNVRYARAWKWKDCAWWYNERTSVGLLAASAWQIGGYSLEEYATKKNYRRSQYRGRGDLYFELKSVRYIAEAKHEWISAGRRSRVSPGRLNQLLRHARSTVVDAETKRGTRLGLLFIVPMVPMRQRDDIRKLIDGLIRELRGKVCYDAAAWVFPKEATSLHDRDHVYPGVVLLVLENLPRS
jgi:hypothetical protein